ncbi:NADP-dependent phosphogluconate dehydrogenase [Candidatus Dojkabacteria bacterium]|uniref:6-phosphogluconate dehydrogenase, decarboxylating n=1 Tax=Candidatus Dojkabacteria bacterium TaxID=2099670 RepID=A0A955RK59_9BACT|nr:NADP-dependent phosphogluconate dehydrogenase [Candidatus Dojkabacteria bacterium]
MTHIGLIGLGVMGASLARNIANNDFTVVVYNRTKKITEEFLEDFGTKNLRGSYSLEEFAAALERPRKVIVMVKAGDPVDAVIEGLLPYLEKDDIVIDAGNAHYKNTIRREHALKEKGIHFVGTGVSGGEYGALVGPSIMPGGSQHAWENLKDIFEAIAAKDFNGKPCVTHIGENGAGHFVKMVHNGIEYGIMQVIAEAYELLKYAYDLSAGEIAEVFEGYNKRDLESFLFEIVIDVLKEKDSLAEGALIDVILDKAGNKGTGMWTSQDALERGVSIPSITGSLFARYTSSYKDLRSELAKLYPKKRDTKDIPDKKEFISLLESALIGVVTLCYAQGFDLISLAAQEESWNISLSEVSRIWQGGCIIRSKSLEYLQNDFHDNPTEVCFLKLPYVQKTLKKHIQGIREMIVYGGKLEVPTYALSNSLLYFDSFTSERTSANVIQGLRDRFGSHTYERTDREGSFHTEWKN